MIVALTKSFHLKKPGTEIQRVCSLREVVLGLDYTSKDNMQMMDLLLMCFQSPAFLKNDDVSSLSVLWNINFISVIHGTFKNQLEFFSMIITAHIAEIYFRAWKKAEGDFLEKIESSCVQDLMQNAIFLHRSSPIVSYFHSKKGCEKVDKMLSNLYKPILWKALTATNFEVRANATLLFTEAFPVLDMENSNKSKDEAIQKQLDTVMVLLDDPHPTVRSNAILGVCKILAKYWELLPAAIITDFLKKLVMELAFDSSSPDVRCSVFKCLIIVLDNSLSHPILEKLLPTLKYSLHDNSEKVRIAFLDMLLKVKAARAAKFWSFWSVCSMDHLLCFLSVVLFWSVCSMDHLLARLAIDSLSASKRIVDLLFKSFFPVNESDKEWCSRCITLIQMNPAALMLAIRRLLNSCIETQGDLSEINESNKENSAAERLLEKDRAVVSGLLEVVVILWRSVEQNLKQSKEAKKYTFAKFGNVISKYFHTFEDERCTVPLIQMASLMPPAAVPTFSCGVLSRLRKMESGVTSANFSQLLDCMCSWGQAADVLELVTDWLSEALPQQPDVKRRKVQIMEKIQSKPDLALDYLEYLFTHYSTREKVLDLDQRKLTQLLTVLENWRSVLFSHLSSTADDKSPSVEIALKVFTYHGRLGAHLQQKSPEGREYLLSLENVAAWVAEEVLPFLTKLNKDAQITESFLTLCRDVLLVGLGDKAFKGLILHLCSLTLLSVLLILKEKIVELLARQLRKEPEEGRQLCHGVFSTLFAIIIVEKRHLLQKVTLPEEVVTPESVKDMPPLSSVLLSVILKLPSLTRSFLAEVSSSFESEAVFSSLSELAAVLQILSIIRHTGQCKASLKMAASSVQQQLHSHAVTSTDIQRVIYESSVKTLNEILDL
ncbi:Condensin-2 complex subunit G2 [Dissostichus eleginoides]|uniref:Condensin-2 complex subunit G2 n=1 Tax=Dissostichus eleginoides TaxID=100907 RepID=A0AAD9EXV1_DISEL|nr:Condensin-2 complex subunit G2 [Dissostichus eleginoides]